MNYVPRRTLPVISVSPVHISASPLLAHVDVTNREAATAWGHDCPNAHGPSSPILDWDRSRSVRWTLHAARAVTLDRRS